MDNSSYGFSGAGINGIANYESLSGGGRRKARRGKRKTARRSARKTARRSARKTARRSAKRSARKTARRSARKTARRSARKTARRSARKTARRSEKRSARRSNRKTLHGGGRGIDDLIKDLAAQQDKLGEDNKVVREACSREGKCNTWIDILNNDETIKRIRQKIKIQGDNEIESKMQKRRDEDEKRELALKAAEKKPELTEEQDKVLSVLEQLLKGKKDKTPTNSP